MSHTAAAVNQATIQQWLQSKMEPAAIEQQLATQGLDEASIALHVQEYKRVRNAKKQLTGFVCMGIGAMLGFISCVTTLINPFPDLYYAILYGLTGLAIVVIFIGLYFVFE
ncbi:hypothetical protein [Limnovirga soli]|uniref:Uncharacterized protein n=1 Tax=Limnovirga soli TaxID=2656915 RepID=A0A8J8JVY2_9BACT|nr:hypothetical protein [Limnovirga soli]NNV54756.1 hypothetical protein [Limnovirga soli]